MDRFTRSSEARTDLPKPTRTARIKGKVREVHQTLKGGPTRVKRTLLERSGITPLIQEVRDDLQKFPYPLQQESPFAELGKILSSSETFPKLLQRENLREALQILEEAKSPILRSVLLSREFITADNATKLTLLLSHTGVGPGKIFQILASDDSLPVEIRQVFESLKSNGAPTRTLPQAQQFVDTLYGSGKYTLQKRLGVGTIGEVYSALDASGKEVVIKTLKAGVTSATLEAERKIALELLELCATDPSKKIYQRHLINNLYDQWLGELDFTKEAQAAKKLLQGARRYHVAQALDLGFSPTTNQAYSLVLEKAPGVSLDKINQMLRIYNENPAQYALKFSELIAEYPWLAKPEAWKHQLPHIYRDAINEQTFLRITKGAAFATHGDPHGGNFLISCVNDQLKGTFIDAGLTVHATTRKIAHHLSMFVNTLVGNAQGLAHLIVDSAKVLPDKPREDVLAELTQALNTHLFRAGVNVTDGKRNTQIIEPLLQRMGILVAEEDTVFLKAQMQAVATYLETANLVGFTNANYLKDSMTDIRTGVTRLIRQEYQEAWPLLQSTFRYLWKDSRNALKCILQYVIA